MRFTRFLLSLYRLQHSDHYGDSGNGDYDPYA